MRALPLALLVLLASCSPPCRTIAVAPLALICQDLSTFTGEVHFEERATFESFLSAECLPEATDAEITAILDSVNFAEDVVFVAVNNRAQAGRCLRTRVADGVEVCQDGLRISFSDGVVDEQLALPDLGITTDEL